MQRFATFILVAVVASTLQACSSQSLSPWHTEKLNAEYVASDTGVQTFADYLVAEERVFSELEQKVYSQVATGPEYGLVRFSNGSAADPQSYETNWNRTFELEHASPRGGVLLLHGMSDSPYSLHAIGQALVHHPLLELAGQIPGNGNRPKPGRLLPGLDVLGQSQKAGMTGNLQKLGIGRQNLFPSLALVGPEGRHG